MTETEDAVVVFTARSPDRILREGGSQAWVLNPARAKRCRWLVCTQNRHNPDHEFSDATEPHGTAFLVGKISRIVPAPEDPNSGRWMIAISEYARIDYRDLWDHGRNPVRYTSIDELGIDLQNIEFQAMESESASAQKGSTYPPNASAMLTIAEAKKKLAKTYGVNPDAIEITIRG